MQKSRQDNIETGNSKVIDKEVSKVEVIQVKVVRAICKLNTILVAM